MKKVTLSLALVSLLAAFGTADADPAALSGVVYSTSCPLAFKDLTSFTAATELQALSFQCEAQAVCRCRCLQNFNRCVREGSYGFCSETFYACDDSCIANHPAEDCEPVPCG